MSDVIGGTSRYESEVHIKWSRRQCPVVVMIGRDISSVYLLYSKVSRNALEKVIIAVRGLLTIIHIYSGLKRLLTDLRE